MAFRAPIMRDGIFVTGFATLGLGALIVSVYLLNELLPNRQQKVARSLQKMTLFEPEEFSEVISEPEQEPEAAPEPLDEFAPPEDLFDSGLGSSSDLAMVFSSGSSAEALSQEVLSELNTATDLSRLDEVPKRLPGPGIEYPRLARKKGLQGFVTLNLLIAKDGRVLKSQLIDSQPKGIFEEAAVSAARQWAFSPPRREGEAVQVWMRQTIRFDLEEK